MQQWPVSQPVDEFIAVGRGEYGVEGVPVLTLAQSVRGGDQVQVMVAKDADRAIAQSAHEAQRLEGFFTAIDEVTAKPERIALLRIAGLRQQRLQFVEATLYVADGINGHTA